MNIKLSGAMVVTLGLLVSGQTARAQYMYGTQVAQAQRQTARAQYMYGTQVAQAQPSAAQTVPAQTSQMQSSNGQTSSQQVTAATPTATGSNNVKGNLEFDALGFKGSLHFDGNPLSIMQQPNQGQQPGMTAQPMSGMQSTQQMPMQGMPMSGMQPMQQMPMQGMPMSVMQPMQQMPMQGMPMSGMQPMQQMPMQGMPMSGMQPMQQMQPMQPMQQGMVQQMQPTMMQQMPMVMQNGQVQQVPTQRMMMQTAPGNVMQTAPQQGAAAPPMIDFSGVEKAARAIAPSVIKALPALGLPAAPAFIDQSSKVIQKMFPGQNQPAPQGAAMTPMMQTSSLQPGAPLTMPMASTPAEASVEVLNALDQFQRAVRYNLEMAQEAAYLAGFGDPTMRATSALEAQKNANEARVTAERATSLAGNFSGEAAQLVTNIRDGAARTQAFADQARVSSNNSNGLAP